jgi:hypothetical protein
MYQRMIQLTMGKMGRSGAVLLLVLFLGLSAFAQGAGDLTGVVTDSTGAVVPKLTVTLTNESTGISRTTDTTAAGVYRFTGLPVTGTYSLKIDAKGFKTVLIKGIVVSVGTTVTKDITLQIGTSSEVVNVEAGTQLVQTTESAVSTLVDQRIWQQMPLEVRNQNSFIDLVAGVTPDAMAGSTRGASVNGARGGAGNYMVEGMDNNDQGQGGRGQLSGYDSGGAVTSISPEAIQEYRVITNTFAAEYGKAGGFVTDTVLKSGTNQWHGSLFEYNRVQALAANHYFSNRNGLKDSLVRNQFGGSIGGPIIKDRTFFFFTTEYHRARSSSPIHAVSTTQQFLDFVKSGQFETFMESDPNGACVKLTGAACAAGSLSNSATLGPIFTKLAAQGPFPLATSGFDNTGQGLYTSGLIYPVPVYGDVYLSDPYHLNEYRYSGKIDHKLSNNDQLSGMILWQHAESGDPYSGGGNTIGPAYINEGVSVNTGVTWNHTFTPTILNTFKASYLRHRSDFPAPQGTLGIPMILTAFDPMEVGFGLYAGLPQYFTDNQFQFQDAISVVHGKHSFKFGGEYRRIRNGSRFYNDTFGTFYPWGVEDLVTDLNFTDQLERAMGVPAADQYGSVYYASAAVDPTTGSTPNVYRGFRANELAWYFQDDYRLNGRLTLNYGVRYEYFGPPHNFQPNIDSNFYFGTPVTPIATTSTNPYFPKNNPYYAQVATGTFQVRNHEIWNKDTNNFAPRFGFAWDMLGNSKLVMRAGAGIMYDRIWNNLFENIRFNPPYFSDNQIGAYGNGVPVGALDTPGLYTVPFSSTGAFASGYSAVPNPRHMDQNMVSPYYEQYHLGFEWEFAKGFMFEPEYIGTMGHKLTAYRDINTFNGRMVAGLGSARINPNIGADNYRSNDYSSNYHALQLTVRKTFSSGLAFNASYTFSKALDTISDAFNSREAATVTDTMNIKNDYGPADFYIKHRFVTNFSYDLPFLKQNRWLGGWGINSIISVQSGVPFTPYSSSGKYDLNKNGLNTDRLVPTTAAGATYTGGNPADGYFNTADWGKAANGSITYYQCPASINNGQWCDAPIGRNSMIGPGYANVDFNVTKAFKVNERAKFTFQANFFNLFNRANFGLPTTNITSSSFGKSTSTYDPRITQLALRFDF